MRGNDTDNHTRTESGRQRQYARETIDSAREEDPVWMPNGPMISINQLTVPNILPQLSAPL